MNIEQKVRIAIKKSNKLLREELIRIKVKNFNINK